jgi:hypothetical protein
MSETNDGCAQRGHGGRGIEGREKERKGEAALL